MSLLTDVLSRGLSFLGKGAGRTVIRFVRGTGAIINATYTAITFPFVGKFLFTITSETIEQGSAELYPPIAKLILQQTGQGTLAATATKPQTFEDQVGISGAIGTYYFDKLLTIFAPPGPTTPLTAEIAVKKFIGLNLLFATNAWVDTIIDNIISDSRMTDIGDLPLRIERALGIGRMVSQSLRGPINLLVADPLEDGLLRKHTPNRLSVSDIQDIAAKGYKDIPWFKDQMLSKGFDAEHALLIWQIRGKKFSEAKLKQLYERGVIDASQLEIGLKRLEYTDEDIELAKDNIINERTFEFSEDIAKEALTLFQNGQLGKSQTRGYLREANWSSDEISLAIELGELRKLRVDLSPSQLLNLMGDGLMTSAQVATRLQTRGYDPSDAQLLIQQEILSRKAKPKPAPAAKEVTLTQAQILSAYRQGVILEGEARERLKDLGLDSDDIDILIELNQPAGSTLPA